jgi:hypothetical protein
MTDMKEYDELRRYYKSHKDTEEVQCGHELIWEKENETISRIDARQITKIPFRIFLIDEREYFCKKCWNEFIPLVPVSCLLCGSPDIYPKRWVRFFGNAMYFSDNLVPPALKEYIPGCKKMLKDVFVNAVFTERTKQVMISSVWSFFLDKAYNANIPPEKWFV